MSQALVHDGRFHLSQSDWETDIPTQNAKRLDPENVTGQGEYVCIAQ